jgi:hypothetical protein
MIKYLKRGESVEWNVVMLPPHLALPVGACVEFTGAPPQAGYHRDVANWLAENHVAILCDAHWSGRPTVDWPTDTWVEETVCRIVGRRALITAQQTTFWYVPEELVDSFE